LVLELNARGGFTVERARIRSTLACILVVLIVAPAVCVAQEGDDLYEMSLDDLLNLNVTTASKKQQSISEAPAIISVLTAEDLEQLGVNTLTEAMPYVPGFTVMNSYWRTGTVTARGVMMTLYTDKMLMLINGVPAYDASALEYYLETVPVNAIERIEIIRGPGSTLYGTNAFSAVINVITKTGAENEGPKGQVKFGSFATREVDFSYGHEGNESTFFFAGQMKDDQGYDKVTKDEAGVIGTMNYEQDLASFFGSWSWREFTVESGYSYQRWGKFGAVPVFAYANMGHRDMGRTYQNKLYLNGKYERDLSNVLDVKFSIHLDWMNKQVEAGAFPYDVFQNALGLIDSTVPPDVVEFEGKVIQSELQMGYQLHENHSLIAGVAGESRINDELVALLDDLNGNELYEATIESTPFSTEDYSAFIQLDGRMLEKFGYVAGIRGTFLGMSEEFYITPRAGVVYNHSSNTSLKALYGEAFRSPGPQEQYYNVPNIIYGHGVIGETLDPEKIRTTELALDQKLGRFKFRVNGFYTNVIEIIGRRQPLSNESNLVGSALIYDNLGDQTISGVEAEIHGYPTKTLEFFVNCSYKQGVNDETDEDIDYLENLTGSGALTWKPTQGFGVTPSFEYVGERKGTLSNGKENKVDAFALINLSVRYQLSEELQVSTSVRNMFDVEYKYPEWVRKNLRTTPGGPGRSVFVTLSYK
jgi:iron complex outermembrane receptor protein